MIIHAIAWMCAWFNAIITGGGRRCLQDARTVWGCAGWGGVPRVACLIAGDGQRFALACAAGSLRGLFELGSVSAGEAGSLRRWGFLAVIQWGMDHLVEGGRA